MSGFDPRLICDTPCADRGFESYRYKARFGWVMIGAVGVEDALSEASRSINGQATIDNLQIYSEDTCQYETIDHNR